MNAETRVIDYGDEGSMIDRSIRFMTCLGVLVFAAVIYPFIAFGYCSYFSKWLFEPASSWVVVLALPAACTLGLIMLTKIASLWIGKGTIIVLAIWQMVVMIAVTNFIAGISC